MSSLDISGPDIFGSEPGGPGDPLELFASWFADAEAEDGLRYPGAACLATRDGEEVDARVVLVHAWGERGFVFGTDVRSPKAEQLAANGAAALVFHWSSLDRQVRVRGRVEPGDDAESDLTFEDRPRGSRITAWASTQGAEASDRKGLEDRWQETEGRFDSLDPVPRPETWRAYRLVPSQIEFWQASRHRLHHRRLCTRRGEGWRIQLLEP